MHQEFQQVIQKSCRSEFLTFSAIKLLLCELVAFIDMSTYILTEGMNFKTFLKKNYAFALDNCYLSTKKLLNMELNMILIVLMEFSYIRYS